MVTQLMMILTETPTHVGTGASLSVVDLPIARERLTQFPEFPASGLKGALRSVFRGAAEELALFGPAAGANASEHAGSIALSDARLLLFPVRSMRQLFVMVTCPTALYRFWTDAAGTPSAGLATNLWSAVRDRSPGGTEALCSSSDPLIGNSGRIVLEETSFRSAGKDQDPIAVHATSLADLVRGKQPSGQGADMIHRAISRRLVVVSDDVFRHFVTTTTEITAHVALSPDTKTVKEHALFYVEDLPAETVLYSRVTFLRERRPAQQPRTPQELAQAWASHLFPNNAPEARIQIGGDETTGKGRVVLRMSV